MQANNIISCRNFSEDRFRELLIQALESADLTGQRMAFAKETGIYIPQEK